MLTYQLPMLTYTCTNVSGVCKPQQVVFDQYMKKHLQYITLGIAQVDKFLVTYRVRSCTSPWIQPQMEFSSWDGLLALAVATLLGLYLRFPSNYAGSIWFCFTHMLFLSALGTTRYPCFRKVGLNASRLCMCLAHLAWLVCSFVLNFTPIHAGK